MKLNKKYLTVTIDEKALVEQAVEANLNAWTNKVKDRKKYKELRIQANENDKLNSDYWRNCEVQALAELLAILETVERIFPDHKDLITDLFYSHYN